MPILNLGQKKKLFKLTAYLYIYWPSASHRKSKVLFDEAGKETHAVWILS